MSFFVHENKSNYCEINFYVSIFQNFRHSVELRLPRIFVDEALYFLQKGKEGFLFEFKPAVSSGRQRLFYVVPCCLCAAWQAGDVLKNGIQGVALIVANIFLRCRPVAT